MSHITISPLPPLCATLGQQEFPGRLLAAPEHEAVRKLNVGLLNLMPNKDVTERQWLRLLLKAEHPYPLHLHLLKLASWQPTHAHPMHMARYYATIETMLASNQLDMLIITGAPLGRIEYGEVKYWAELSALMCELEVRGVPTLFSCWAAQAALQHLYQVPTQRRQTKLSGVFDQRPVASQASAGLTSRLLSAVNDFASTGKQQVTKLKMPQSRFALPDPAVLQQRLTTASQQSSGLGLSAILTGEHTGATVLSDTRKHRLFFLGHPEYEYDTLALEYARDLAQDPTTQAPLHYQLPTPPAAVSSLTNPAEQSVSDTWQALGAVLMGQWLAQGQALKR